MDTDDTPGDESTRTELREVALSHRYRWRLLYCLFTYANPIWLPDVAHQLTVWDSDDVDTRERLQIYNALYHDHLPALRDADLVTYRQRDDEVELGPAAEAVEPVISDRLESEIDDLLMAERTETDVADPVE